MAVLICPRKCRTIVEHPLTRNLPKQQEEGNRPAKRGGRQIAAIAPKISHENVNKSKKQKASQPKKRNRQRSRKKDAQGEQERHLSSVKKERKR